MSFNDDQASVSLSTISLEENALIPLYFTHREKQVEQVSLASDEMRIPEQTQGTSA
jgi:hypothetical protein